MEGRRRSPTICTLNSVVMPHDRKCPPVGADKAGPAGCTSGTHAPPPPPPPSRSSRPSLCVVRGGPRWSQPPPPSPCLAPAWPGLRRARGEWGARMRQVRAGGTRALGAVAAASLAVLDARALEASSVRGAIAGLPGLSLDGSELQLHELDLPGP